tara:strand:+ start:966 stop:1256 length:291 start_codon:yes stop_codon:yes gene_type:complete
MNHNDKLLYLKALTGDTKGKKKVIKDIGESIRWINKASGFNDLEFVKDNKPKDPLIDTLEGKKFIIGHSEEFLEFAIDYSMADRVNDVLEGGNNLA